MNKSNLKEPLVRIVKRDNIKVKKKNSAIRNIEKKIKELLK